jgi:hypothetical protein
MIHAPIWIIAFVVFAEPAGATDNEKSVALLRTIPKSGVVNSEDKPKAGTGFLIVRDGSRRWMVTCAHVVKNAGAVRVDFSATQHVVVAEAYVDEAHDQALLLLDGEGPPTAAPFQIRAGELAENEREFKVIGFARGAGPDVTTVPAALHKRIDGSAVGVSGIKLDPNMDVFQVGVVGEEGASGSPMVDKDGLVVGVYMAASKGRSDIGYCTSFRYIGDLDKIPKVKMDEALKPNLEAMLDYQTFNMRVLSNPQARPDAVASTAVIEQVPLKDVFPRFFHVKGGKHNDEMRNLVEEGIGRTHKKINHVINSTLGIGMLVPEGYEISERYVEDSNAYILTMALPGSQYKARVYSRRVSKIAEDREKEAADFVHEVRTFLADVPKFMALAPGEAATRPGEAVIGPGSWPGLYRDGFGGDLVTFRAYGDAAKGLVHLYEFNLCRRINRFEAAGISFPVHAYMEAEPTDEFLELQFILCSIYDLDIGLERVKQLRDNPSLTYERELPTPTPGAGPEGFTEGLQGTFPPIPNTTRRKDVPPPAELFAANLGIHYRLVTAPNGAIGARLTRNPAPGTPAARIQLERGVFGFLEKEDTIFFLDGVPIADPDSILQHFDWTSIAFVDGRTGLQLLAWTFIPH